MPEANRHVERQLERLPDLERRLVEAMAALPDEERTATSIARSIGYDQASQIGPTAQRLDTVRGIISRGNCSAESPLCRPQWPSRSSQPRVSPQPDRRREPLCNGCRDREAQLAERHTQRLLRHRRLLPGCTFRRRSNRQTPGPGTPGQHHGTARPNPQRALESAHNQARARLIPGCLAFPHGNAYGNARAS